MASSISAADNTDITRGTVQFYDAEKQFGFVEVYRDRVFFHQSACRVVEGTPEEPVFTGQVNSLAPVWWRGMRRPPEIILKVVEGSKGPKAAVWGYRPTRTWLEELLYRNQFSYYANGHIELRWSEHYRSRAYRQLTARLTEIPLLQPGEPWTLTLEYDAYDGPYRTYGPPTRRERKVVLLDQHGAHLRSGLPHGRMSLEVYMPDEDELMTVTFNPHSNWRGWEPGDS